MRSRTIKQIGIAAGTLSFLYVFLLYGCKSGQPQQAQGGPQSLPVISVHAGDETTYQEYPASVEGSVNVEIRPQVSGTIEKIYVDEGAYVKAGQPLFKINDQPYSERLNNAIASMHAAEGAVNNTQLEVDKITPLVQNKIVSDVQLKTAKTAHNIALANLEQAKAEVAAARINVGYTFIKAPVNGYIGRLMKKQGSLVSPSDVSALTSLSDVHEVHVYFALGETDFITFKSHYPGATIEEKVKQMPPVTLVLADNSDYEQQGKIDMIDGQFDKNTGAISVRATFPNAGGLLRSGNTGRIKLSLPHSDAIILPAAATIEMQDKVFVYTVGDSNKVSKQLITIAGKSGSNYLVKDGLKSGDRVVFSGIDHLHDGDIIQPEPKSDSTKLSASK